VGQIPPPDMWFISGRLPRMVSESSFKLMFSHRIRSLRIHLGVCFCGTNTEGPWRKEQTPYGKTADEMGWGNSHGSFSQSTQGRGSCQFSLVVASID